MGYTYMFGMLISFGFKFKINDKLENVTIIQINVEENKIYIEHDSILDVKNLITGRAECFLKIDSIVKLEIDCINNICNVITRSNNNE